MGQPSGFVADWDGDVTVYKDAGTTLAADGETVQQWNLLPASSGGANQSQSGSTARPVYKTGLLNGHNILRFDGSNDYMAASFTLVQPFTVAMVFQQLAVGAGGAHDALLNGVSTEIGYYQQTGVPSQKAYIYGGSTVADSVAQYGTAGFVSLIVVFNGASSLFSINGTTKASGNVGANNPGGITVAAKNGGTRTTQIDVARVIVYASALSAQDQADLNAYLQGKYFSSFRARRFGVGPLKQLTRV